MARRIEGTIYRLTYTATWHSFVECSSKEDLFKYIAHEVINGQIVTSVNEMCKDGSTPKVKVHTDKEFKRILKQLRSPREIPVAENYWTNERGCHYSLTPCSVPDAERLPQFWIDTTSLKKAREKGKEWIADYEKKGIKFIIKRN